MANAPKLKLISSLSDDAIPLESGVFRAEARVWANNSDAETFALHDAKNMACALRSNIEWLASELGSELEREDIREALLEALDASSRLSSHLKSALDEKRDRQDGLQLSLGPVSPVDLVTDAAELLRRRFEAAYVGLRVKGSSKGHLALDRALLSRVLQNLLENALRFSPSGTTVTVLYGRYGGNLVISVSDAGPGVAEDQRERIFGMFERGEDESPTSTGLGLAFCRTVAEAHGGCLAVEDAPKGGACFLLSIPWNQAP